MTVYHGSYIEIQKPDLEYGRFNLDFGKGFYVTTLQEQAEKWATRRAIMMNEKPIVNIYKFDDSNLNILLFDGYTEKWLDFVVKNRTGISETHNFDAIYGNIADDDVAAIVNDYIRLLNRGRMSSNGKYFFIEQLQYSKPNNQYCVATQKGIAALNFVKSYTLEV